MDENERQRIFDDWMRSYERLLFKVVRAHASTAHDREELFQEIAFQLWRSIPGFKRESAETTWIYRVALYAAMAWSRSERKRRDHVESYGGTEPLLARASSAEDPRLEWLYAQIAKLDPIERSLILLLLDGLSHREIADTMGISEGNVGVKLHRIKKSLVDRSSEARDGLH